MSHGAQDTVWLAHLKFCVPRFQAAGSTRGRANAGYRLFVRFVFIFMVKEIREEEFRQVVAALGLLGQRKRHGQ